VSADENARATAAPPHPDQVRSAQSERIGLLTMLRDYTLRAEREAFSECTSLAAALLAAHEATFLLHMRGIPMGVQEVAVYGTLKGRIAIWASDDTTVRVQCQAVRRLIDFESQLGLPTPPMGVSPADMIGTSADTGSKIVGIKRGATT